MSDFDESLGSGKVIEDELCSRLFYFVVLSYVEIKIKLKN